MLDGQTGADAGSALAARLGDVLVEAGHVLVARSGAGGGDLAQRVDEPVDVLRGGAESDAGPDGSWKRGTVSRLQLGREAVDLAVGYAEQPGDEGVRAEAPVTDTDRVLGAQDGGQQRMSVPRDLWRYAVALDHVAALDTAERLARVGLPEPTPSRAEWPAFQAVGERLWAEDYAGVLFASAARPAGRALCVFRPGRALPGSRPLPPPEPQDVPPAPPRGLRT